MNNSFLAKALGSLNQLLALGLVLTGLITGLTLGKGIPVLIRLMLGGIGGLLLAIMVCGLVALLVAMHETLQAIHQALVDGSDSPKSRGRRPKITWKAAEEERRALEALVDGSDSPKSGVEKPE